MITPWRTGCGSTATGTACSSCPDCAGLPKAARVDVSQSSQPLDTPFGFEVETTVRTVGPDGPADHRPRHGGDTGLHARRHRGFGQGRHLRTGLGHRRPSHPGQHLPPVSAARPRAGRPDGRAAPLSGLGRRIADRQRRVSRCFR